MNAAYTFLRRAGTAFVGLPTVVQLMIVAVALIVIHVPFYAAWIYSRNKLEREREMRAELQRLSGR